MSAAYIICKVLPGVFDTEYYVMVNGSSAYYVSRNNVKVKSVPSQGQSVEGYVLGYVVQDAGDKVLVQLPGEAVIGGVRTWVERKAIQAA